MSEKKEKLSKKDIVSEDDKLEKIKIRLTLRAPEEVDRLIRCEAERRGTNINSIMLYILNEYFKD